jgi:signal transduction histidine kinase
VGRLVKTVPSRTTWAALIAGVALGVPCAAWYLAGSRATEQEARRITEAPLVRARQEAERIAGSLTVRLESLRHSETRRSFLDYEPHLHALPGECSCETRLVSPLAQGPADPLIWAHFQIDEVGQLELPLLDRTDSDGAARSSALRALSGEQAILDVLECAADDRITELPLPSFGPGEEVQGTDSDWIVTVGPFQWHHVSLEHQPALLALRQVQTPAAALIQGFVIRREALEQLLEGGPYPARLWPRAPEGETEARLPLEGDPWSVAVDASGEVESAVRSAGHVRAGFRASFTLGLVAAIVGGVLVVGLVWQAERLARQRARFAAAAAHELRTPLAGLRMYGEMLADGSGDHERTRGYARRIAGESERLGRVVTNLLGFARLERGELRVQPKPGDLAEAVRVSLDRLAPALENGGAGIEASIAESLPPVEFDRDALHQILQNLLDNAASYVRAADDRTIRVVLEQGPAGPCLSVIDRGPGVEPSLRGKLFDAFVRDPSPDAPDGLGLGLALVRALARAQKATVDHADESGGGSRFTVRFRAASPDAGEPTAVHTPAG